MPGDVMLWEEKKNRVSFPSCPLLNLISGKVVLFDSALVTFSWNLLPSKDRPLCIKHYGKKRRDGWFVRGYKGLKETGAGWW